MKKITGWHVFAMFAGGFGIIISVNMALAVNAVRTFPGLEVKNSYVASQSFDADRSAQTGLDWQAQAQVRNGHLYLSFTKDGQSLQPEITSAIFGRATTVTQDQTPEFQFDGVSFVAPVSAGLGNWNLRVVAVAGDGTTFKQRIVVRRSE